MFSWFRSKAYTPVVADGNPGRGTRLWSATPAGSGVDLDVDLVGVLAELLAGQGVATTAHEGWLQLPDGYLLRPDVVSWQRADGDRISTTTAISVCHERHLPAGLFEYQHSTGPGAAESIARGFERWAELDLVTLRDAIRPGEIDCMTASLDPDKAKDLTTTRRRIVFGPTLHYAREPAVEGDEEFCPCCLLTRSIDGFRPQLGAEGFVGIRLYALREADGSIAADCRVNGIDWSPGQAALRSYVSTWPQRGFEYRKQYVVIQPAPG